MQLKVVLVLGGMFCNAFRDDCCLGFMGLGLCNIEDIALDFPAESVLYAFSDRVSLCPVM